MKKEIMLIDGLNMFIRSYIVNPTIDSKGRPLLRWRGCTKRQFPQISSISMERKQMENYKVRMFQPDEVVIFCWDGQGGMKHDKGEKLKT